MPSSFARAAQDATTPWLDRFDHARIDLLDSDNDAIPRREEMALIGTHAFEDPPDGAHVIASIVTPDAAIQAVDLENIPVHKSIGEGLWIRLTMAPHVQGPATRQVPFTREPLGIDFIIQARAIRLMEATC